MATSTQAKADGTLEQGPNPSHPTHLERETLLMDALGREGWNASITSRNFDARSFDIELQKGDESKELVVYFFPNLNWANRDPHEKRIQLSRPYNEHQKDFELENDGDRKCLLIGVYRRDKQTVFCAWDSRVYRNHAQPSSCYVRIEAIAQAMRDGFGQSIDNKRRLVCCFRPEFIHYYVMNMKDLHDQITVTTVIDKGLISASEIVGQDGQSVELEPVRQPRNRIIYGAPGTGKSHSLNEEIEKFFPNEKQKKRITFYPEYVYSQLIGTYKPIPVFRKSGYDILDSDRQSETIPALEPLIDYRFVPGPLLELYVLAKKNQAINYALIIEELNRADAAGVFGDFFQLLDRDKATGESKFPIYTPRDVADFLISECVNSTTISLPGNLYIWCTMNSADQGVMPLDAAFKRRWSFEYLPLNQNESVTSSWEITLTSPVCVIKWNDFRNIINDILVANNVQEDRLLGPFFLSQEELGDPSVFKNKVLLYLRDDVLRHEPELLFSGDSMTFSNLVKSYDNNEKIFIDEVHSSLSEVQIEQ